MKARKENKVYEINKTTKDKYAKAGYDIYDDDNKLIERGKNKTVSYEEYEEIKKELEQANKIPNNAKAIKNEYDKLQIEYEKTKKELEVANSKINELEQSQGIEE